VFVWAASGMMASVRQGLERSMHVAQSRPAVRAKLVDLALIAGAAFLVVVTVAVTLLGNLVHTGGTLAGALTRAATFVLTVGVVLLLYRFVPARGLRVRDAYVGAILTALLLLLISLASHWIYDKTTRLSVIYGSLTAALIFLYSVYLAASAILLGAEVAAIWSLPEPSGSLPLREQLRRGVLGLFVKR
jgi:YihY family inner membrane protein